MYNNEVPEALATEFEILDEEFKRLDAQKTAAEEIVKMSEPRKILWTKELKLARGEVRGSEERSEEVAAVSFLT